MTYFDRRSRRRFLREILGATAAASVAPAAAFAAAPAAAPAARSLRRAVERTGEVLPSYVADLTGNSRVGKPDRKLVEAAIGSARGFGVWPPKDYDHRADVHSRGWVEAGDVASIRKTQKHLADHPEDRRARPITVAWHYGWYNNASREPRDHQVWFKSGGYSSRNPNYEMLFNALKNEFGVTVDALSWADPELDNNLNANLFEGYLRSRNLDTRHVALLYESLISMQPRDGERADFTRRLVRERLVDNFGAMGEFFAHVRDDTPGRMLWIDGRPVIFVYSSHTWGLNADGTGEQYDLIDATMEDALDAFTRTFGRPPFVIGEEMTLGLTDQFDGGRRRRSANFDGVFTYHHVHSDEFVVESDGELGARHLANVKAMVRHTYQATVAHRSRFTGKPMLVVPSLAAGFSKTGAQTLYGNRESYAAFLEAMLKFHHEEFMVLQYGERQAALRPALVSVGSWNEEWEGHAIFPSEFNHTLSPRTEEGFDYVMALKQACGWNHYAGRRARLSH
jgi:hypothetical protein